MSHFFILVSAVSFLDHYVSNNLLFKASSHFSFMCEKCHTHDMKNSSCELFWRDIDRRRRDCIEPDLDGGYKCFKLY